MSAPAVSVIIPTRNRRELLARAIGSVQAQSLRELEIIVIDDASTDATAAYLAELASTDSRIRILRNEAPCGPAAARNAGIAAAKSEWLAFLDDDDEWLPRKLELQHAAGRADVALVYSPFVYIDASGGARIIGAVDASNMDPLAALARGNFIGNSTVLVRTALVRSLGGFDDRLVPIEDWDLWLRIAAGGRFRFVPEALVRIHHSPASVTSRVEARRSAAHHLVERVRTLAPGDTSVQADALYAVGYDLMTSGAPADGRRFLRAAVRARPWPPQRWLMTAVAHAGAGAYAAVAAVHGSVVERTRRRALGVR